jgi:hypothetical protein
MEIVLAIWMTLPSRPILVPMPNIETCQEAIAQAKADLNPARAHCSPKGKAGGATKWPALENGVPRIRSSSAIAVTARRQNFSAQFLRQ